MTRTDVAPEMQQGYSDISGTPVTVPKMCWLEGDHEVDQRMVFLHEEQGAL